MSISAAVWTGIGLLTIGLVQAAWTLLISPRLFTADTADGLNEQIDRKKTRDGVAAIAFLFLTAVFSVWNIKDAFMNEPASKQELAALEARVAKLEKGPPGLSDVVQRLGAIEKSLADADRQIKGFVTADDLQRTRKELEGTIKKVAAELQELRQQLSRGQAQGG